MPVLFSLDAGRLDNLAPGRGVALDEGAELGRRQRCGCEAGVDQARLDFRHRQRVAQCHVKPVAYRVGHVGRAEQAEPRIGHHTGGTLLDGGGHLGQLLLALLGGDGKRTQAPGADMRAAAALAIDGQPRFDRFPQQLRTLTEALWNEGYRPRVSPAPAEKIPVWLLGTSPDSAMLAAELGLPYAIALFINPRFDPRIAAYYRSHFRPSAAQAEPRVMLAMNVLCADDSDHATAMAHAADLTYISFLRNPAAPRVCSPDEARAHRFSAEESAFVQSVSGARAVGTADTVRERVEAFGTRFGADELMAVSNTFHHRDRLRSLELLAGAFGARAA